MVWLHFHTCNIYRGSSARQFQYSGHAASMGAAWFDRLGGCIRLRSISIMKNFLRPVFILFGLLTLITGVIYPLFVTGLAQVFFPYQANGSLVMQNNKAVGSEWIGQNFTGSDYFWGRPSTTSSSPYTAFDAGTLTGSSGSNLGPLSQTLVDTVGQRVKNLQNADLQNQTLIPVDLVTASASGLDPHISVSAAYYQIPRIARARGLDETIIKNLVDQFIEGPQFGIFGEPRVNVLKLNLALDGIQ
jgi:potassium-transporting ATPase KdpC subunit